VSLFNDLVSSICLDSQTWKEAEAYAFKSYLPINVACSRKTLPVKKGHGFPHDPLGRDHYLSVSTKDPLATLVLVE